MNGEQLRFFWRDERVVVNLSIDDRDMLTQVLPQLRQMLLEESDPALRRLSPPAQPDDAEAEAFYRQMVADELLSSRLSAIETVTSGIDGAELDDAGIVAWMQSLNALRLVLGERLDVDVLGHDYLDELDEADERFVIGTLYEWLGWLLEQLVQASTNALADDESN